jgi:uncharacterized protein YicC (UPF0701 family)
MTGYASVLRDLPGVALSFELRSVDARFLDLIFKIPDELRGVEPALRERLSGALRRGKVECRVAFQRRAGGERRPALDRPLLVQLGQISDEVRTIVPGAAAMSVAELLRWPGVLGEDRIDLSAVAAEVASMADTAIGEFVGSRSREGAKLAQAIVERIELDRADRRFGRRHRPRIAHPLREPPHRSPAGDPRPVLPGQPGPGGGDFCQGPAGDHRLWPAHRRGRGTVAALRACGRSASGAGPRGEVGKRLDFLMQELNREANTLGSKAAAVEFSANAMELKLLIEQMREQIQNIE